MTEFPTGTFLLLFLLTCFHNGDGQEDTNQTITECSPLEGDHICSPLVGRNSPYSYSQVLIVQTIELSERATEIGIQLLELTLEPACKTLMEHLFCLVSRPPCGNLTGGLLPICPDSCLAYNRLLIEGTCEEGIVGLSNRSLIRALNNLVADIDCFDVSTYYYYDNVSSLVDPFDCTDLFSAEEKETILSRPNRCLPIPPGSNVCSDRTVSPYNYYVPSSSTNTTISTSLEQIGEIYSNRANNTNCVEMLVYLGCYLTFLPCDPETGDVLPICLESCKDLDPIIRHCLSVVPVFNDVEIKIYLLDCFNSSSYIEAYTHMDQDQCIDGIDLVSGMAQTVTVTTISVTSQNQTTTTTQPTVTAVGAIVGGSLQLAAVIILLVLVITIILVTYICRKRSECDRLENNLSCKGETRRERIYNKHPEIDGLQLKAISIATDDIRLSDADRRSYEKVFSSILVPYTALTVGEEIGQGAFGKVYHGALKRPATKQVEDIAIKTIKHLHSINEVESFLDESLLMKDFSHPNIIGLTGVCFDTPAGVPYILLPFMANGSLKDFLKKKRTHVTNVDTLPEDLDFSSLVRICMNIANGMEYLAEEKFVHRDLAARNCMVDDNLVVKVGDFGLARDIYSSDYYRANQGSKIPVKWMAPETLHDAISSEKTDVWSFGVTCWEVFSLGRGPYPGIHNQDILKQISNNERLERPTLCPKVLYNLLMTQCWRLLPEERPPFSQLVQQLQEYWEDEHAYVIENNYM